MNFHIIIGLLILDSLILVITVIKLSQSNARQKKSLEVMVSYCIKSNQEILNEIKDITGKSMQHQEVQNLQIMSLFAKENISLDPGTNQWILKNGDTEKIFEAGKILAVNGVSTNTETTYEYLDDGEVRAVTYIEGKLKSRNTYSQFGAPLIGQVYDDNGNLITEYSYNKLGQVENISHKGEVDD